MPPSDASPDADPALRPAQADGGRWDRITLTLWGLIALAAILRFARLGHPTLWIDEAYTFSRVTGSFEQMLAILRNDGFGPLHYELYWLLTRIAYPSPWVMRIIPAIAGVLMVPAMYALARQLLGRHPALVVAAFTACSSYMMFYARDAKMYAHFWLMVTLHLSSFLWWQRTGRRLAWLCWLAAGLAAVGLHATAIFLVMLEPLMLLATWRPARWRHWRAWMPVLQLAMGLAIILGCVAAHYLVFNQWTARSGGIVPWTDQDETGKPIDWRHSGLSWLNTYNAGQDGRGLMLDTLGAFALGSEWPRVADTPVDRTLPMLWVKPTLTFAMTALIVLLVLGAWPWRVHVVEDDPPVSGAPPGTTWWGTLWILGVWIVLPMYGLFYCRSFQDPAPPWWPITTLGTAPAALLALSAVALPFTAWWLARSRHWARWIGCVTGIVLAALSAGSFLCWQMDGWPAAIGPAELGQLWALAAAAAMPIAWCAAAPDNTGRWARAWRAGLVLGSLFALCAAIWLGWSIVRAHSPEKMTWQSIWFPRYLGLLWPVVAIAMIALLLRLPTRPLRIAAVGLLLGVNLLGGVARIVIDSEPPYDVMADDLHAARDSAGGLRVIFHNNKRGDWQTNISGRYYLAAYDRTLPVPAEFRGPQFMRGFEFDRQPPNARRWKTLLEGKTPSHTLILWERLPGSPEGDGTLPADPLLRPLAGHGGWKMVEERTWRWLRPRGWREGDWLVRRVFVRERGDDR